MTLSIKHKQIFIIIFRYIGKLAIRIFLILLQGIAAISGYDTRSIAISLVKIVFIPT